MTRGLTILVGTLTAAALTAAEPPAFDDAKLALAVKAAIAGDRDLVGLNPFVSVVDRVVAVQGPVPSAAARDRLGAVARGVPGVSVVKVDCYVVAPEDPLAAAVNAKLNPKPRAGAAPASPSATGGLPSVAVAPPATPLAPPPAADDLPSANAKASVVTARRPAEPDVPLIEGGLLGSPVAGATAAKPPTFPAPSAVTPLPPAPSAPRPYPTIPPPNVPVVPVGRVARSAEDVAFAVLDVRKADPRFAGLSATFADGVVTITGTAAGESKRQFADAVRRVTGVGRVEIE
jgi:hypothetical protein